MGNGDVDLFDLCSRVRKRSVSLPKAVSLFENVMIRWALCLGKTQTQAAKLLGMSRRTLGYRLRKPCSDGSAWVIEGSYSSGDVACEGVTGSGELMVRKPEYQTLTRGEYRTLWDSQKGLCRICRRPEIIPGKKLIAYYNNVSGMAVGLVCWRCNMGLECFGDDGSTLAAALTFLFGEVEARQARAHLKEIG